MPRTWHSGGPRRIIIWTPVNHYYCYYHQSRPSPPNHGRMMTIRKNCNYCIKNKSIFIIKKHDLVSSRAYNNNNMKSKMKANKHRMIQLPRTAIKVTTNTNLTSYIVFTTFTIQSPYRHQLQHNAKAPPLLPAKTPEMYWIRPYHPYHIKTTMMMTRRRRVNWKSGCDNWTPPYPPIWKVQKKFIANDRNNYVALVYQRSRDQCRCCCRMTRRRSTIPWPRSLPKWRSKSGCARLPTTRRRRRRKPSRMIPVILWNKS